MADHKLITLRLSSPRWQELEERVTWAAGVENQERVSGCLVFLPVAMHCPLIKCNRGRKWQAPTPYFFSHVLVFLVFLPSLSLSFSINGRTSAFLPATPCPSMRSSSRSMDASLHMDDEAHYSGNDGNQGETGAKVRQKGYMGCVES